MLTLLVDDVRWFRDGRPCQIARSSSQGIALLKSLMDKHIDELWLDHDLSGGDTIMPVVDLLCSQPFQINAIQVHSFNAGGAVKMRSRLTAAGYNVTHHYDVRIWSHSPPLQGALTSSVAGDPPKRQRHGVAIGDPRRLSGLLGGHPNRLNARGLNECS